MKWDGKSWISLETKELSKDETNSYFEGWTNAFSPFAIVAKLAAPPQPTLTPIPTETPMITETGTPMIAETQTPKPTKKVPGFDIVLVLLAGFMVIVLRKRS
jgi:hypothetical protein